MFFSLTYKHLGFLFFLLRKLESIMAAKIINIEICYVLLCPYSIHLFSVLLPTQYSSNGMAKIIMRSTK